MLELIEERDTAPTSSLRVRGPRSSSVPPDPAETAETVRINPEVLSGLRLEASRDSVPVPEPGYTASSRIVALGVFVVLGSLLALGFLR